MLKGVHRRVNESASKLSRRQFLGVSAVAAGTALSRVEEVSAAEPKLALPPGSEPVRVAHVRSRAVVTNSKIHPAILREMIEHALALGTKTADPQSAWRKILKPDDVVGLKFNRSGQATIGTVAEVGTALIETLMDAGVKPERIVCIEAPDELAERFGTTPARGGYDRTEVDFGSGKDQLAAVLDQVTAIVNVPFLKTHNIAGLTCSLKNLSHALVKHPARYHGHGCSPYIGDIVALPQIRDRLRLSLVNALRVVFDAGPEGSVETISEEGLILASTDPVAVDTVGLSVLNEIRHSFGLGAVAQSAERIPYLAAAHRRHLGIAVPHGIDITYRKVP